MVGGFGHQSNPREVEDLAILHRLGVERVGTGQQGLGELHVFESLHGTDLGRILHFERVDFFSRERRHRVDVAEMGEPLQGRSHRCSGRI